MQNMTNMHNMPADLTKLYNSEDFTLNNKESISHLLLNYFQWKNLKIEDKQPIYDMIFKKNLFDKKEFYSFFKYNKNFNIEDYLKYHVDLNNKDYIKILFYNKIITAENLLSFKFKDNNLIFCQKFILHKIKIEDILNLSDDFIINSLNKQTLITIYKVLEKYNRTELFYNISLLKNYRIIEVFSSFSLQIGLDLAKELNIDITEIRFQRLLFNLDFNIDIETFKKIDKQYYSENMLSSQYFNNYIEKTQFLSIEMIIELLKYAKYSGIKQLDSFIDNIIKYHNLNDILVKTDIKDMYFLLHSKEVQDYLNNNVHIKNQMQQYILSKPLEYLGLCFFNSCINIEEFKNIIFEHRGKVGIIDINYYSILNEEFVKELNNKNIEINIQMPSNLNKTDKIINQYDIKYIPFNKYYIYTPEAFKLLSNKEKVLNYVLNYEILENVKVGSAPFHSWNRVYDDILKEK